MIVICGRVAVIIAVLLSTPSIFADWIRLKSGAQIHGKIILQTAERVTLKSKKGTFSFDAKNVVEVHRTTPLPKPKERTQDDERPVKVIPTGVKANARELKLGDCRVTLPLTFTLKRGRSKVPGYDGELLGVYEEQRTGSQVSLTFDSKLPLKAKDVGDLKIKVKAHLKSKKATEVVQVASKVINAKSTVVADFIETRNGKKVRVLQAWSRSDSGCFALSISTPNSQYRLNSKRYTKILNSIRH